MSTDDVVRHVLDSGMIEYRNAAGELHREDGPAVVYPDGGEDWYLNGELHREDGPAVTYPDGTEFWYRDGQCHRDDGPAVVYHSGTKEWYLNGVFHREDGPAVVCPDGTKKWYLNGERHREDGPAIVLPDGTKEWHQNGKRHREDGPAVVYPDSSKVWYLNGVRHRKDGPAVVYPDGNCEYWIYGTFIIGKTIEGVYCLEWESNQMYKPCISTELVVKVMSDRGFASLEELGSWLAFGVLGEDAVPVLTRVRERRTPVLPVLDEYLRNYETYEGLPFSWWYPIVEGAVNR